MRKPGGRCCGAREAGVRQLPAGGTAGRNDLELILEGKPGLALQAEARAAEPGVLKKEI